jgi:His/Glu/Gln/Arg/opine family amino acid ABC transporter permease subunit
MQTETSVAVPRSRPTAPRLLGDRLGTHTTLLGVLMVLVLLPVIFRMDPARFEIFADWRIWRFLAERVALVIVISVVSIALSLPLATILALGRLSTRRWVAYPSIAFIESIRALPVLLVIFYVYLEFPPLPGAVNREALAVTAALTIYTSAVNAELIRAGILSLERGQMEAARSLGLTYCQAMPYVILPQTLRRILPPLIAQFTTLLKDTSLGSIIGMVELIGASKIIFQKYYNPMEAYYVIAIVYFVLNYVLGQIGLATQGRGEAAA